jgi:glucose-6-phosphate dehydrogenase assembly protein OpcA
MRAAVGGNPKVKALLIPSGLQPAWNVVVRAYIHNMPTCETVPVNVTSIERELRNLWRQEAQTEQTRSGEPVVCARTLNLLIYPADGNDPEFLAQLIDPITTRHPSRAILIEPAEPQSRSEFEARVSASCVAHQGAGFLGCELIILRAKPCAYEKLRSVVLPLIVPDLPIFLWWRQPLASDPSNASHERELFDGLAKLAGRIIIDSAHFADPAAQLHRVAAAIKNRRSHAAFSDLAWARLTPWRQLVAQFFDGPALSHVDRVSQVVVEYSAAGVVPPEPLLLAGWLASRLHWNPHGAIPPWGGAREAHELKLRGNRGEVRLRFQPEASDREGVDAIKIIADGGAAVFSVARRKNGAGLMTSVELRGQAAVHRMVRDQDRSTAEMVSKELELLEHDVLYEEALNAAASFITENS